MYIGAYIFSHKFLSKQCDKKTKIFHSTYKTMQLTSNKNKRESEQNMILFLWECDLNY